MWLRIKEIKCNHVRSLNDSNIEVSTQGFEITSSNMLKKLKRKRGKIDLKKKNRKFQQKIGIY